MNTRDIKEIFLHEVSFIVDWLIKMTILTLKQLISHFEFEGVVNVKKNFMNLTLY
jgi:hypothetical protein